MAEFQADAPIPFPIEIDEAMLIDLHRRLESTRWPEEETVSDWSQGVPLHWLKDICDYWRTDYDWRRCEAKLNAFGSQKISIDGLDFHFLHVRSEYENARPLILTHGWPGSIVEFFELIPLLTDPTKAGGDVEDAFHVVVPSLPGFGFSGKPQSTGWTIERTADAWAALMAKLGYTTYFAQGGDWGASVSTELGKRYPDHCKAVHLNLVLAKPDKAILQAPTDAEANAFKSALHHRKVGTGYSKQQATRPQTLGYGLTDSPVGQAAWILEKFFEWTDIDGAPDSALSRDQLLDNVMMYWLTASAASSARLYWESFYNVDMGPVEIPVACTVFPKEIPSPSRRWAELRFKNIIHFNQVDRGGHFAAIEQPEILVKEIQTAFRSVVIN
ncbi:MAG: epoxide hydrolase family protein [Pseudomonadota bacterium]